MTKRKAAASEVFPSSQKSVAAARRVERAVEGFKTAADVIGELTPGMSLFAITRGQISMIDVAAELWDLIFPAAASPAVVSVRKMRAKR